MKSFKSIVSFIVIILFAINGNAQDSVGKPPYPPRHKHPLPPLALSPQFPGGQDSLKIFIRKNAHYPAKAMKHGISGIVEVGFIVTKDGLITKTHILKSLSASCDKEAIRVVKRMPKWQPAMMSREAVEMEYKVDVPFGPEMPIEKHK